MLQCSSAHLLRWQGSLGEILCVARQLMADPGGAPGRVPPLVAKALRLAFPFRGVGEDVVGPWPMQWAPEAPN